MNKKLNILHISDIQTGFLHYIEDEMFIDKKVKSNNITYKDEKNGEIKNINDNCVILIRDDATKLKQEELFQDFVSEFNLILDELNNKNKIDLVIMSGDLGSEASEKDYEGFKEFNKIFIQKNINTLIVPGNHDVNWQKTKQKKNNEKFNNFYDFLMDVQPQIQKVKYCYNKDNLNYYCHFFNEQMELLFIGFNTSRNIDDKNKEDADVSPTDFLKIMNELKKEYGDYIFSNTQKIMVLHHNWEKIRNFRILKFLEKYRFILILGGHIHDYDCKSLNELKELGYKFGFIGAGSLSSKQSERQLNPRNPNPSPLQFNKYLIESNRNEYFINIFQNRFIGNELDIKEKTPLIIPKFIIDGLKKLPKNLRDFLSSKYNFIKESDIIKIKNKEYFCDFSGIFNGNKYYLFIIRNDCSSEMFGNINYISDYLIKSNTPFIEIFILDKINYNLLKINDKFINKNFLLL